MLATIPNLPLAEVPDGKDEHGNVEHHHFGAKRNYAFAPKQHFELGEALGLMDFETAAKLSGARFVVLKSGLARHGARARPVHARPAHERARLHRGQLRRCWCATRRCSARRSCRSSRTTSSRAPSRRIANGTMLAERFGLGNGSRDRPGEKALRIDSEGSVQLDAMQDAASALWLIPTAEVPLTNLVRESIVEEAELPMRLTACTPCFRAEAGAAGKDTRGMIRQHQFTKVELVSITTPEQSKDEHERMLACAEEVLRRLGLHYRVVTLCTGDMGFASQKTYDIEVWLPGQDMYREISSCSVCGDFQARRMNARYPRQGGQHAALRAHAQRLGRRGRPRADRRDGDLPGGGRLDRGAGRAAPYMGGKTRH